MIAAVVLAAGLSRRMGRPKQVLPWGNSTVIRHIVDVLETSGLDDIVVVTGHVREKVEAALSGSLARAVYNPDYEHGEMLSSLRCGLRHLPDAASDVLVALGDHPRIQVEVVKRLMAAAQANPGQIVAPSYRHRRGHPLLIPHTYWDEIAALRPAQTLRDFLAGHNDSIAYMVVDTDSVLSDIDYPEDYARQRPGTG